MKKAAMLISAAVLSLFSPLASSGGYVSYAYLAAAVPLYADASGSELVCLLPATYFVEQCGNAADGVFPAAYLDLRGYMRTTDAEFVDYEPVTKFAARSARPRNDGLSVNLRDKPDSSAGNVLVSVPSGATLTLYGSREGNELFAGAGTAWQYVRYDSPTGVPYYGYVYAAQLDCDPLVPNKIEKVVHEDPAPPAETPADVTLNKSAYLALAAVLCVPAGIIMLALFHRPDSSRTPRHARRE